MNVALIPARGGSKGIPRKNLQLLGGFPLVSWAIRVAQNADIFDRIIVSTDDLEIAQVAREFGVDVPFLRPPELAQDKTLQIDTILHALNFLKANFGSVSSLTLLQPTSPFRTGLDCQNALNIFRREKGKTVISVCNYSHVHSSNLYRGDLQALSPMLAASPEGTLRQFLPKSWWRNGAIYVFSPNEVIERSVLYTETIVGYEMPLWQSHNIDEVSDLVSAEHALGDSRIRNLMMNLFPEDSST